MHHDDQVTLEHDETTINAEIAIVGMAGRFPGAKDVDQLWDNLKAGVESITFFSDQELLEAGVDPALLNHPDYVKANPILDNIDHFDAHFFDINPREAEILDPQQRLFLECAWEAIEQAGYDPQRYRGLIGIYAGVGLNGYLLHHLIQRRDLVESVGGYQLVLDNDKDFLPSRVAYKFNLTGAAVSVQTACSTSLVAVHLGCQSLLNGETDMVLAGGSSIRIPHRSGYLYQEGMILSPDGHCRAFDAKAKGTVDGSGVAIVVLKRLEDAIADGDYCYAVIKGSAINNDGSLKVGYTAPSIEGQAAVIGEALALANVDADSISYIEAHGTGTELGDPIEIAALNRVFRRQTDQQQFCGIGSIKTNLGHLDTAAGVAGLIKTALALKHGILPPSLNFEIPNPKIDLATSPFYVNTELKDWIRQGSPRRAGVSSFGIGGTNAHVILEEAPDRDPSGPGRSWQLLLLSAKTASALDTATVNLAHHLQQHPTLNLADVAYTLSCGRQAFNHRRILVCQDLDQAAQSLHSLDPTQVLTRSGGTDPGSLVFLFPGQGSQHVTMGLDLYQEEPHFRDHIDHCADLLNPLLGFDLRQVIYPGSSDLAAAEEQLRQTAIAQPALFVIEYALAQLWIGWGLAPKAMIGHSIGEYVAACLAGVFRLEDGLALVAARGQLMQQLPSGSMLSLPLTVDQVQALLAQDPRFSQHLSIAAFNEPSRCVVSGSTEAVDALEKDLAAKGIESRRLHTSHAFHSPMMDPILAPFRQRCQQIQLQPPQIPYLSNVTGTWITTAQATDPDYWAQHLRQPVRFAQGIDRIAADADRKQVFLEVGPSRALTSLVLRHPARQDHQVIASMRHVQETRSDVAALLSALGQLWLEGASIDWTGIYADQDRHRLPLPTYPFERQRYWVEPTSIPTSTGSASHPTPLHPTPLTQKADLKDWFYLPSWKRRPLPPQVAIDPAQQPLQALLVFVDDCGVAAPLIQRLTQASPTLIQIKIGQEFSDLGQNCYSINPQSRDDYERLIQDLKRQDRLPKKVVHLWTLALDQAGDTVLPIGSEDLLGINHLNRSQYLGFYSLLFWAQAWGKHVLTESCDLIVITQHLQHVTGEEDLAPAQATLLGPIQTIPQENPSLTCRCVDLNSSPTDSALPQDLVDHLIREIEATVSDKAIAYRGRHRWIQSFEPFPLESPVTDQDGSKQSGLRQHGVYLITGGLSYVGYLLAEHLAKTVQARLIVTGRSGFPPREDWPQYLHSTDLNHDRVRRQIEKVQQLEALGSEVLVLQADVANLNQMQTVLATIQDRFGPLNGVIHAAGAGAIWGETLNVIESITAAECQTQFQAKIYGTLVLGELLKDHTLDFCALTSSLSSILGGLGFVSYTAVNSFMDLFVQRYNTLHQQNWISIDWDGWQGSQEIILADRKFGDDLNALEIEPEEGVQAFERILAHRLVNQVIVSVLPLEPRIEQWVKRRLPGDQNRAAMPTVDRDRLPDYQAPGNSVEQIIAGIFQSLLGVKQVGIHDSFFELGGDSLTGTQLLSKLRQTFAIDLPIITIFDSPTIAQLAAAIQAKQQSQPESAESDLDKLSDLLDQVESLSEEDIAALSES